MIEGAILPGNRRCISSFLTVLAGVAIAIWLWNRPAVAAPPPNIWLAPLDNLFRPFNRTQGPDDFPDLFAHPEQWSAAAEQVSVFKIYPQYVNRADDEALKALIDGLGRLHISLALEYGALTNTPRCGQGVEGYNGTNLGRAVQRLKKLGANLAFIAMDEPLWFGHRYGGQNACHDSIDSVAADVARNLTPVLEAFPEVRIGDIEPYPKQNIEGWDTDLKDWLAAFRRAMGRDLAFFHVDVMWKDDWMPATRDFQGFMKTRAIEFGIIYNGMPADQSNDDWQAHTIEHYSAFETGGSPPDDAIFQSWHTIPNRLLPDSLSGTMTHVVLTYRTTAPARK